MEEFKPEENKIEIPDEALVQRVLTGLTQLRGAYLVGDNWVEILDLRLNKKLTLEAVGKIIGVNRERVRQKQERALRTLLYGGKITREERNRIGIFLNNRNKAKK